MPEEDKKKKNYFILIFIPASIAAFLVFAVIIIVLPLNLKSVMFSVPQDDEIDFSIKSKDIKDDPFITPVPRLEDYIDSPIISNNDPEKGGKNAPVTIVYFSDYSCSFCHEQEKVINKINEEYPGQVSVIWKDYPDLNDPASYAPALAARCAQAQNNFWPFHDRIFLETENGNRQIDYNTIAAELALDIGLFKKCLDEQTARQLINDNIEEAGLLSISGIPFVYVNNRGFLGELSYDDLKQLVELELAREKE